MYTFCCWFYPGHRCAALVFLIPTTAILKAGTGVISGDNTDFGVSKKSDANSDNEDLIPCASAHANQNDNSTVVKLVVKLPAVWINIITMFSGALTLLHQYRSNLSHL